jgi:hypothetical protein
VEVFPNNFNEKSLLWTVCYELLRIKFDSGEFNYKRLRSLKDIESVIRGEEIEAYFMSNPESVERKANSKLRPSEIYKFAEDKL